MNKIRVIDLLNKIAKGEEVPKKIKYNKKVYEYDKEQSDFSHFNINYYEYFLDDINTIEQLNAEVEIIEEEKEIENIPFDNEMPLTMMEMYHQLEKYNYKINEIIDVINDMRDKEC